MDWSQYALMDPHLLLGVVNTELRNHFDSLHALCQYHAIDQVAFVSVFRRSGLSLSSRCEAISLRPEAFSPLCRSTGASH